MKRGLVALILAILAAAGTAALLHGLLIRGVVAAAAPANLWLTQGVDLFIALLSASVGVWTTQLVGPPESRTPGQVFSALFVGMCLVNPVLMVLGLMESTGPYAFLLPVVVTAGCLAAARTRPAWTPAAL